MHRRDPDLTFTRDLLAIAGCGLLVLSLVSPAQASGVLLPDDSNGAPNLGFAPAQSAPPAAATNPAPTVQTTAPQSAAPQSGAQPSPQRAAPAAVPPATQAQTAPQPTSPQAFLPYTPVPNAARGGSNTNGNYKIPTMVVETPETPDISQIQGLNLPFNASVELSSQSIWSNTDITTITGKLGISASKVTSLCRISLNGIIVTDKTAGIIDSHGTTSAVARFDGKVRNIVVATRAMCDTGTSPPDGAGVIQKTGSSFLVPLNSALCRVPANGQVHQIIVTHGRAGMDECAVQ